MSHTPWKVVLDRNNHWGCVEVDGPALRVIGFTIATNVTPENAEAVKSHAHLIAAAPIGYELASEILRACDPRTGRIISEVTRQEIEPLRKLAEQFMSKAEGKP